MNTKGLRAEIFRWSLGDCSKGGLSSKHTTVTILSDDPNIRGQVFEPTDDAPAVRIVRRRTWRDEYVRVHAEPLDMAGKMLMHGGTFVYSRDSRYYDYTGTRYPIALHDRHEGGAA